MWIYRGSLEKWLGMRIRSERPGDPLEALLSRYPVYKYTYTPGALLIREHVDLFKRAYEDKAGVIRVTLDLGLSLSEVFVGGCGVYIEGLEICLEDLDRSVEDGFIYKILGGRLARLDLYGDGKYYKIKPVSIDRAPTIEINGIQMHRTVGIDPWRDSQTKVSALGRVRGLRVLEIGTGLGYTASNLIIKGAGRVITIERDRNVLDIATMNPWSRMLGDSRISIVVGDALDILPSLCDGCFDKILHDPPRISVAEHLYSLDFYRELYRVLRGGGVVFHYTGEPGKHSNVSYLKGVKNRLSMAGFYRVEWVDRAKGFLAFKGRD